MQGPLTQQGPAGSELETIHNLTKGGGDKDENMDDDAQELDTTCMSAEKQPASTSTEGAPRGLLLGACQALATQLEKDILAEEIEVVALKRLLHLQKVRAECKTLHWELELLGVMEVNTVIDVTNTQATWGNSVEWMVLVRQGQPQTDTIVSTEPVQK